MAINEIKFDENDVNVNHLDNVELNCYFKI